MSIYIKYRKELSLRQYTIKINKIVLKKLKKMGKVFLYKFVKF